MKHKKYIPSPPHLHFPAWQGIYEATLRETDIHTLFKSVEITEAAILTRRDALTGSSSDRAERDAMDGALQVLLVIKQARLNFFSPEGSITPALSSRHSRQRLNRSHKAKKTPVQ